MIACGLRGGARTGLGGMRWTQYEKDYGGDYHGREQQGQGQGQRPPRTRLTGRPLGAQTEEGGCFARRGRIFVRPGRELIGRRRELPGRGRELPGRGRGTALCWVGDDLSGAVRPFRGPRGRRARGNGIISGGQGRGRGGVIPAGRSYLFAASIGDRRRSGCRGSMPAGHAESRTWLQWLAALNAESPRTPQSLSCSLVNGRRRAYETADQWKVAKGQRPRQRPA